MAAAGDNPEIGATVTAAGLATNYIEAGSGAPVVLIHGSGPGVTAYANWRLVVPALGDGFRAVAPDIAGFGYTERRPDARYGMDFWVAHILGVLDALGIDRAHFIGNSFGGALTLALAARHPDRVRRMVLMGSCGTVFPLTEGLDAVWGYEPSAEAMERLIRLFVHDGSIVTPDLVRSRFEASLRPGCQESYAALFPAPRQRHIEALATPEEAIRAIPHRTLVVHGRDDRIIPLEASLALHRLIPRSELHVFGQCGHWTQIEKRDRFLSVVRGFLTEGGD
jgi:pimeloyl-ACP methyl ester carboxylesterase